MLGKSINHAVFRSSLSCIRMGLGPEQFLTRRQRAHTACVKLCGTSFSVSGSVTALWLWSMCIIWMAPGQHHCLSVLGWRTQGHSTYAQEICIDKLPCVACRERPLALGFDTCYWSWFCSMSFLHEQRFDYPWWMILKHTGYKYLESFPGIGTLFNL